MNKFTRAAIFAAASAGLLSGCTTSVEDRITAAIPPGPEVATAKANFDKAAEAMKADTEAFERDYKAQLKMRVLECSHGFEPGLLDTQDKIREKVGNAECFKASDAKLVTWLGMRRLGWMASMPPLRPVPANPSAMLVAPGNITQVLFADAAGIALLQSNEGYAIVDFDGKEIRRGESNYNHQLALSANGRLLVDGHENEAKLVDTESGEVLGELKELGETARVQFVGDKGLLFKRREGGMTYRDLGTGTETTVPISAWGVSSVLPMDASGRKFLVIANGRVATLQLEVDGTGFRPTLGQEWRGGGGYWNGPAPTAAHGAVVYTGEGALTRFDLATASTESLPTAPLSMVRVVPTPDPDRYIVNTYTRGGNDLAVLSWKSQMLAPIDTSQLLSQRLQWVPAAKRNVMVDGMKVAWLSSIPTKPAEPLADVIHKFKFEQQLRQLEAMDRAQASGNAVNDRYGISAAPGPSSADYARAAAAAASRYNAAAATGEAKRFSAGETGLIEAVRAGVLRLGGPGDIDTWKMAYMSKNRRMPGKEFDEMIQHQKVYVVTGNLTIPADLTGAHSVVFVVNPGVPFPMGSPGHSPILDVGSGQCSGAICGMYLR